MGTPNSNTTAFVTGQLQVPENEITAEEWLAILKYAVKSAKPYLEYLPDFKEIRGELNAAVGVNGRRVTPSFTLKYGGGLSEKTRFYWCDTFQEPITRENVRVSKHLMLSLSGRWFLWGETCSVSSRGENKFTYTATESTFEWLSEEDLLEILRGRGRPRLYLDQLNNHVGHAVERLTTILKNVTSLKEKLGAMGLRIKRS